MSQFLGNVLLSSCGPVPSGAELLCAGRFLYNPSAQGMFPNLIESALPGVPEPSIIVRTVCWVPTCSEHELRGGVGPVLLGLRFELPVTPHRNLPLST